MWGRKKEGRKREGRGREERTDRDWERKKAETPDQLLYP